MTDVKGRRILHTPALDASSLLVPFEILFKMPDFDRFSGLDETRKHLFEF